MGVPKKSDINMEVASILRDISICVESKEANIMASIIEAFLSSPNFSYEKMPMLVSTTVPARGYYTAFDASKPSTAQL